MNEVASNLLASWTLTNIQNFISNLGFPIFVALYYLIIQRRFDSKTQELLEEIKCIQAQLLETKLQVGQATQQLDNNKGSGQK